MIARKENGRVTLFTFYCAFHELRVSEKTRFLDKYGRLWYMEIDPETNLNFFSCKTEKVFPDEPQLENQVKYI